MSKKSEFEKTTDILAKLSKKEEEARNKLDATKEFNSGTTNDYRFISVGRGELQIERDIAISFHINPKYDGTVESTCSVGGIIDWIPDCLSASTKKILLKHSSILKEQIVAAIKVKNILSNAFEVTSEYIYILDAGYKSISAIIETSKDEFGSAYFNLYIEATDEGLKISVEKYKSLRAKLISDGYLKL
ncbi:MAG: hypothetical protein AABY32_03910 [Nanoarchaeota archaeon]